MGRYRKIDVRVWNDAKFRGMSDRGKLSFFFILTHPNMTSLGAMRATINGLSAEIGWPEKAFREAFREASERGMCVVDEEACFVWLPNFLKYNGPESPNVVKSWSDCLDLLPECGLKDQLLYRVKGFAEGLSEGFAKALPEAFAKSMPNQEHEHEQEQEQEQEEIQAAGSEKVVSVMPEVNPAVAQPWADWLAYKAEKQQRYKLAGLRAAIARVNTLVGRHGSAAVAEAMQRAMANGWTGWDQDNAFGSVAKAPAVQTPPMNQPVPRKVNKVDWSNAAKP